MTILIEVEDKLSAEEVKGSLAKTVNFKFVRTLFHNGSNYLVADVPDETILREFLRCLKANHSGVRRILMAETPREAIIT